MNLYDWGLNGRKESNYLLLCQGCSEHQNPRNHSSGFKELWPRGAHLLEEAHCKFVQGTSNIPWLLQGGVGPTSLSVLETGKWRLLRPSSIKMAIFFSTKEEGWHQIMLVATQTILMQGHLNQSRTSWEEKKFHQACHYSYIFVWKYLGLKVFVLFYILLYFCVCF